jgi:hypothetical protein
MQARNVQSPSYAGRVSRMALALALLVFFALPLRASEFWESRCKKDLSNTLEFGVAIYEDFKDLSPVGRATIPRAISAGHAFCFDRLIATAKRINWRNLKSAEKKRFMADLMWVGDLLKGDLKEVYRQAKFYRSLGDEGSASVLGIFLSQWAIDKQLPEAKYDLIQGDFLRTSTPGSGRMLSHLAGDGYLPAMLDAARRFLNGDGVHKDRGAAYYWLKRAEFANGDTSSIMTKPHERLLLNLSNLEWYSLKFNILQFGYKEIEVWLPKAKRN